MWDVHLKSNTEEAIRFDRLKKGETAAKYSTIANFLAIIKGVVGVLSGSIALLADSVHSFSDIFALSAVYIGWVPGTAKTKQSPLWYSLTDEKRVKRIERRGLR